MSGKFTGVGTGPGDPALMTIKAVEAIRNCDVAAVPVSDPGMEEPSFSDGKRMDFLEKCVAYQIARQAVPEIDDKRILLLPMPMIKDKIRLKDIHDKDACSVAGLLDQGFNVVFLTLGDPTVYSTCMYVHKRLKRMNYHTELIPGIPSFCAAAARLNESLAENRQEIHILPASYRIEESLSLSGTKILMKAGKKMPDVKRILKEKELEAAMVVNCGMDEEAVYYGTEEIPEQAGYYSLLLIRENKKGEGL